MAKAPRSPRNTSIDSTRPASEAETAPQANAQTTADTAASVPQPRKPRARKATTPDAPNPADHTVSAGDPSTAPASPPPARKVKAKAPAKPGQPKAAAPAERVAKPAPVRKPRVRRTADAAPQVEVVHGVSVEEAARTGLADVAPAPTVAPDDVLVSARSEPLAPLPPRIEVGAPAGARASGRDRRRILMVASEAVPYAKTGGLADVVSALPKALGALGHDVTVVMPRYRGIAVSGEPDAGFDVEMGGHHYRADVFIQQPSPGVRVALIDHPAFFDRDALYGLGSHDYADNPRRFAFLALAALEFARLEGRPVDVVHAHDWQGGLAPVYLKTRYADDPVLGGAAAIFTIHNIAYQGNCSSEWLPQLGLGWDLFTVDGLEYWLHASFLKAGIMFADLVTTVSPRYARELMTPEFAFGFEGVVRHRAADLVGILNGIDVEVWDPATDKHLPRPYSADDLSGKADAKRVLLDTYGLGSGGDRPIIAMISRMVDQKGLDLIASVAEQLPHLGAAFVILGTGEPWYEEMWRSLSRRYPDRVGVRIGFDEPLSHVIEAGADIFMMPSRFEPCGLNQMYSLRYGTLPVVRSTGGLDDTVRNYEPASGTGNGFKFNDASGEALIGTLRWALHVFHNEPERWRQLQRAGMGLDFSWDASARAYLDAYERASGQVARRQHAAASI